MPIKSGIAIVTILPRFIPTSILLSASISHVRIAIGDLHPVMDVHVVRQVALSVAQYASTSHRSAASVHVRLSVCPVGPLNFA